MIASLGLTAVAALSVLPVSGRANAQGLFDVLRGIFGGHRPPPLERVAPPLLLDGFPGNEPEELPDERGGPQVAYCVRLCDGRYFPLPRNAGAPGSSPEKLCSAMCPAAQTAIFRGDAISRAVASDGRNYSSIEHAFLYREKNVEGCTCTSSGPLGLAKMEIENDPTLRPGDIAVTDEGAKVFTGNPRTPHRASEFTPAENYRGLPRSVRREMSNIRVRDEIRMSAEEAQRLERGPETRAANRKPESFTR